MLICPSMLSADPIKLGEELLAVEKAGANAIHWDVMDGAFVDAITFGHHIIAANRRLTNLRFDVHLMVENPGGHIENFSEAGADIIVVHVEACKHLRRVLSDIKSLGRKAGAALNPATPVCSLKRCADILDMVVVMSVNPGSSGQSFIESQLEKISELREILPPYVEICVDGGITDKTIGECARRGASSFVSGSYLFKSPDYSAAINKLKESCN
jgi:ribulose-phosphate 3-epimerase